MFCVDTPVPLSVPGWGNCKLISPGVSVATIGCQHQIFISIDQVSVEARAFASNALAARCRFPCTMLGCSGLVELSSEDIRLPSVAQGVSASALLADMVVRP